MIKITEVDSTFNEVRDLGLFDCSLDVGAVMAKILLMYEFHDAKYLGSDGDQEHFYLLIRTPKEGKVCLLCEYTDKEKNDA